MSETLTENPPLPQVESALVDDSPTEMASEVEADPPQPASPEPTPVYPIPQADLPVDLMVMGCLLAIIVAVGLYTFMEGRLQSVEATPEPNASVAADQNQDQTATPPATVQKTAKTPSKPAITTKQKPQTSPHRLTEAESAMAKELNSLNQSSPGLEFELNDPGANVVLTLEYWNRLADLLAEEHEMREEAEMSGSVSDVARILDLRIKLGYQTSASLRQLNSKDVHTQVHQLGLRIQQWHKDSADQAWRGKTFLKNGRLQDPNDAHGRAWGEREKQLDRELKEIKRMAKLLSRSLGLHYQTPFPPLY